MHYEVKLRELTYEADSAGDLRIAGSSWKPVKVFNKDTIPIPLTFDALCAAQAHTGRPQPGGVRIVRVTDEGQRELVEVNGA